MAWFYLSGLASGIERLCSMLEFLTKVKLIQLEIMQFVVYFEPLADFIMQFHQSMLI